ncbi:MAG: AbrB family looped-hinge helix DNA binding protein [Candidatus Promineifilaceae bacterium]|jgi:AbrB family looped-hinge helix DNA binding protein
MVISENTVKLSSKGQITLPKRAREQLGTTMIHIVVEEDQVRLEPAPDLAGSLKAYAGNTPDHAKEREHAWGEVVREKHSRS